MTDANNKRPRNAKSSSSESHLTSQKSLRIKDATVKLSESRAKLAGVRTLVTRRLDGRDDTASQTLRHAVVLAEAYLAVAEGWVERLQAAPDESWQEITDGLDGAWEDFSQALKKIVVRL